MKNSKVIIRIILILAFIIFIVLRISFLWNPFWGMEYEDSYIFCEASRMIYEGKDMYTENLAFATCVDGSILNCNFSGVYGGHFLAFPYVISIFHYLFGYGVNNVFLTSICFSVLIPAILYLFRKKLSLNDFSVLAFLTISICTPFLGAFNSSGLSETFSSSIVFIYFICLLVSVSYESLSNKRRMMFLLLILPAIFLLAALTKRENIILIVPTLATLVFYWRINFKKLLFIALLLEIVIIAIIYLGFNPFLIEQTESTDISNSTFALKHLILNLKSLVAGFSMFQIWGACGLTFVLFLCFILYKSVFRSGEIDKNMLVTLSGIISFIAIYSSHYRSYYQLINPVIDPFDSLRYAVNYLPLILLFIAQGFNQMINKPKQLKPALLICFILLVVGFYESNQFKSKVSSIEKRNNIAQIEETLLINVRKRVIITDIPSAFRCYAANDQRIIDYYSLNDLVRLKKSQRDTMLRVINKNNEIEMDRFNLNIKHIHIVKPIRTVNNYTIDLIVIK